MGPVDSTRAEIMYDEVAIMDEAGSAGGEQERSSSRCIPRSPLSKTRSLSEGEMTPIRKLSPSPLILEANRRASKDDSSIPEQPALPVTPRRPKIPLGRLSLQMPQRELSPAQQSVQAKQVPLSPKLDHSHIYASPTNALPRRSRGLDFSRAATSLHHSILAESSPDSSPTISGRAINIPNRSIGDYGTTETTNSLWSMMGNQEKMNISSSLGSGHNLCSDISSSSDEDDLMDEDMDEAYITTPQVTKMGTPTHWPAASPAVNSLLSFQQRQRPRKQPKRRTRGLIGLGFGSISAASTAMLSKSPPSNNVPKDVPVSHSRRESISWAANQLHISGSESDDTPKSQVDSPDGTGVISGRVQSRRVTRRGNLLPKTKGFARIRAALAEEGAPVETEAVREAEVVRQVRESDMDLEPRMLGPSVSAPTTAHSSPNLPVHDNIDEICEDAMIMDPGLGLSSSFKQQAIRNSKGRLFWDTFPDAAGNGGTSRTTPPPPPFLPRGSSAGINTDDMLMDSPSAAGASNSVLPSGAVFPMTTSSSGGDTPQPGQGVASNPTPPSVAEITRRINSKRRRDDDFDPVSFKRRAVSPGISVHNSPIMQSPLQRDMAPWGSRPGSNGGDKAGGSGAPSENGSQGNTQSQSQGANGGGRINGGKGRVGFQGMVDTHDGITKLSIE